MAAAGALEQWMSLANPTVLDGLVFAARALAASSEKSPLPLLPAQSDEDLARRAQRGDRWAEEAIYRRYVGSVFGTARRLLGSSSDAEDVVQETFLTAFGIWDQLRDAARLRQWLMQIAVHKVHRRFRRRRLLRALGLDRSLDEAPLESLARSDLSHDARAALRALDAALRDVPPDERLAWMLRHVEGCALDEVAEHCSCSLATAKRRIAGARKIIEARVDLAEVADD